MKDLGSLKYYLGIEVSIFRKGIFLSQRMYALGLLQETSKSNQVLVDKGGYRED